MGAGKGGIGLAATRLVYSEGEDKFHWVYVTPVRMFLILFSHGDDPR